MQWLHCSQNSITMSCPDRFPRWWRLHRYGLCRRPCVRRWSMGSSSSNASSTSGCHIWLSDWCLRADTKALIVAAQDGVIHTHAYQLRVLKLDIPQTCQMCHSAPETVGHVLSCCEPLSWTLYKQRHDRVLYQMVLMLCVKHNITVLESLRWGPSGWDGVAVLESSEVRLVVDLLIGNWQKEDQI